MKDDTVYMRDDAVYMDENGKVTPVFNLLNSLTKRELFAAMALQGLISTANKSEDGWGSNVAGASVSMADALIKALEETE